jgi:hypothetical protein
MMRGNKNSIFVLDEPDIYLHPDLQNKLLDLVRINFGQFFLATHSSEIINHSKPGDIVSINSKYKSAKRVQSDEEYNQVFSYIGSIENVELSKLSRAKRVIFFEGKDKKLLAKFSEKAGFKNLARDSETLVIGVGGFGQWKRVVNAAWTFKNILQVDVNILSIFDKDYRDPREVQELIDEVSAHEVGCLVWSRKEVENYLLIPEALVAAVSKRLEMKGAQTASTVAEEMIINLSEKYKHDVQGQVIGNTIAYERRMGTGRDTGAIASDCSKIFEKAWSDFGVRLGMVPGKQFIADLSSALQADYGVAITQNMILEEIKVHQLDTDLVAALRKIDNFCAG